MEFKKSKHAAMEMSVGTIVTIVLLLAVLVMGLFFVQRIRSTGSGAIDQVNNAIQNQINQLFTSDSGPTAIYPASQSITLTRGDTPKGFAFAVKNPDNNQSTFSYKLLESSMHNCGSLTETDANGYIIGATGTFTAGPKEPSSAQLIKFDIPQTAPACTIVYTLQLSGEGGSGFTDSKNIFVTLQ